VRGRHEPNPSTDGTGTPRGPGVRGQLVAPLPLTWHAVVVPIHFGVWTVFDEVSGFSARMHLRAMSSSIARELLRAGRRGGCVSQLIGRNSRRPFIPGGFGHGFEFAVGKPSQRGDNYENQ